MLTIEDLKNRNFLRLCDFAEGFYKRARDVDRWQLLSDRFDAFEETRSARPQKAIPKRIHQIWIGGNLPSRYHKWMRSWRDINKDWEYRLWDESSILKFGLKNERAYRKSLSYGAKSDIARYEILERLGGVYVDTDFECLKPLVELAERCTFFACLLFNDTPEISNGLIGCTPGHAFLRLLIDGLEEPIMTKDGMEVLGWSGPLYLTRRFFKSVERFEKSDIILPSSYFFPLPNFVQTAAASDEEKKRYCRESSYAIHYWETSWMKPNSVRALLSRIKKILVRWGRA